jgi:hypothetical protein
MRRILIPLITLVVGAAVAIGAMAMLPGREAFGSKSESRNTQIINSITREEQVVLVSLGIQGLKSKEEKGQVFGFDIPGSERAVFLRYSFTAKLGLEGKDVKVTPTGEKQLLVSIPEFIFIGHANEDFEIAVQKDGALGWMSPSIDPAQMVTEILNDEARLEYVKSHDGLLRDQAKAFYGNIIRAIDPTLDVQFEFRAGGAG